MKVTIYTVRLFGGGAERVICNLANYLADNGNEVSILTLNKNKPSYSLRDTIRLCYLTENEIKAIKPVRDYCYNRELRKYIKNHDIGCYIAFLPISTILLLLNRKIIKAPIIASERNAPGKYKKHTQWALKMLCKRADAYVFQTNTIQQWYAEALADTKYRIIPNAINPDFLVEPYSGKREKRIVSCGRLVRAKDFFTLIRAFAAMDQKYRENELYIYGDGPLKDDLNALCAELNVSDRVHFCGYVSNVPETIKNASLYVMSSINEGMPNALMEAMALGLPCVATDCEGGGAKFLIQNGENGILTVVGDVEQMKNAMEKILGDSENAEILGKNALKIRDRLNHDNIYGKWLELINEVTMKGKKQ